MGWDEGVRLSDREISRSHEMGHKWVAQCGDSNWSELTKVQVAIVATSDLFLCTGSAGSASSASILHC
jgi:hypothetical protein